MRILITGDEWCQRGLAATLRYLGHEVLIWDTSVKPAFDVFDEFEPAAFLTLYEPGFNPRPVEKCIQERPRLKVANVLRIPPAADVVTFSASQSGAIDARFTCEIACVEDYNPYAHDRYVLPLCNDFDVKLFGRGWPVVQGLGVLAESEMAAAYRSAKVVANFQWNGGSSRIAASGGIPCSPEFPESVFCHPDQFRRELEYLIDHDRMDSRRPILKSLQESVWSNTYFHRVAELFSGWGLPNETKRAEDAVEQLRNRVPAVC